MQASAPPFIGSEEAIIAHLFYASAEIQVVTVHVGGHSVPGRLLWPEADSRTVGFRPDTGEIADDAVPRPGRVLKVQYASLEDGYSFLSALKLVGSGEWRLSIPRQVDRQDRRLVPREPVISSQKFTLQLRAGGDNARRLLLYDISPAGIAVIYDPKLDKFEDGKAYLGVIHVPDHSGMRVRFEALHSHAVVSDPDQRIVGCRFRGLGFAGCRTLAEILAIWKH